LTKYGILLAAVSLGIWCLYRKGLSRSHIGLLVLTYLLLIAAIFVILLLIVDGNLSAAMLHGEICAVESV
jgi:hypothetical protein